MSESYNSITPSTPRPYVPTSSGTSGTTPRGSGCSKIGCFSIIGLLVLLGGVILLGYLFIWPMLFPNDIGGTLLDLTYAEGKDGKGYLWIQTDPSFKYIQETESPGYKSVGQECAFCRTETFIYDPKTKTVLKKFTTDYDGIPPTPTMFSDNGNVWIVSDNNSNNEPLINVYDAASGDVIMDTKGFINKHPQYKAGITQLRVDDRPYRLSLKTKDGLELVYLVNKDTSFKSISDYNTYAEKNTQGAASIYTLVTESGSSERKKLYKITGPAGKIFSSHIPESLIENGNYILQHYESTATPLTPDKVYLEGEVLYYDDDGAVIIYQDQIGKTADRLLSRVDSEGNIKWTKSTANDELFEELKLDEDENPFGKMFFMKGNLKGDRGGNMFIFKLKGKGILCFDWNTGEKIWDMDI